MNLFPLSSLATVSEYFFIYPSCVLGFKCTFVLLILILSGSALGLREYLLFMIFNQFNGFTDQSAVGFLLMPSTGS